MAKPTEPGWYWLVTPACGCGSKYCTNPTETWEIVKVAERRGMLAIVESEYDSYFPIGNIASERWGGKITQEPAPDPPPPF